MASELTHGWLAMPLDEIEKAELLHATRRFLNPEGESRMRRLMFQSDTAARESAALKQRLAECEAALRIADEALSVCVGNNADTRHKRAEARQQIAIALSNQVAADAAEGE